MKKHQKLLNEILEYLKEKNKKDFVIIVSSPDIITKTLLKNALISEFDPLPIVIEEVPGVYMREQLINIVQTNYKKENTSSPTILISEHNPLLEGDLTYFMIVTIDE